MMRTGTVRNLSEQADTLNCVFKAIISPFILIWKTISDVKEVGKPYKELFDERDQNSFDSILWMSDKKLS